MYNLFRSTEGADAIGPLRGVRQARVNRGTVAMLSGEVPVGVPLIDTVPQYFGHPVAGTTGRGLPPGNGAAAVRSENRATAPTTLININTCARRKRLQRTQKISPPV